MHTCIYSCMHAYMDRNIGLTRGAFTLHGVRTWVAKRKELNTHMHPYTFVYIHKLSHRPFRGHDGSHARATVMVCKICIDTNAPTYIHTNNIYKHAYMHM